LSRKERPEEHEFGILKLALGELQEKRVVQRKGCVPFEHCYTTQKTTKLFSG